MVSFLARIFIKDYKNTGSPQVRQAYGMLCGSVGIGLNILLFIGKFIAGILSGSIAITADAVNNLSDAGSSFITLIGFKMAGQKPDSQHPFGHGRIEYLSGLFVSAAVLIMAFELVKTSIEKIIHPEAVECSPLILVILAASILIKCYMAYYNKSLGKKLDSAVMNATAADSFSDMVSTFFVFLVTIASLFTDFNLDGWCGILVGLFIFYTGITAMKETVDPLLGQPPAKELVQQIMDIVNAHPSVLGIHDLLVHDYGPGNLIISLHAEVSAKGDILKIHDEIDNIERELKQRLNCTATIHMDPVVTDDDFSNQMRDKVSQLLKELDPELKMHDFRMVTGPSHTNLIFDVVVPYNCPLSPDEVEKILCEKIRKLPGNFYGVICIDQDYGTR
ncbi:MAG TPA: cation diffusion facilitator family transporter [Candidatus Blautia stercorigallinarum]|uniref:Cation diffusion facilitator family transporter n=1 Tax=Candidatus Blautia stercorigallinarum TaxID=2838501 RepID=A0A9D1PED1_9FIRM|nr:cation diffusion facilitator family transporter [Candidatus Blautia stercorigallinarum]